MKRSIFFLCFWGLKKQMMSWYVYALSLIADRRVLKSACEEQPPAQRYYKESFKLTHKEEIVLSLKTT